MKVNSVMIIFFIVLVVFDYCGINGWTGILMESRKGELFSGLFLFSFLDYLRYFLQSFYLLQFVDDVLHVVTVVDAQL